ncbi:MAG: hypothetical protein NTV25_05000 [Methanothrix sp.]|nr:hypothetical protein [Methanothrix sp.]
MERLKRKSPTAPEGQAEKALTEASLARASVESRPKAPDIQ